MLLDIFIPFLSLLIAEFGDKTQIAVISMSSKSKNYVQIFMGVMMAFIVIDGLAIFFASEISNLIPQIWIKIISGSLFILFGVIGFLIKENENEDTNNSKKKYLRRFPIVSIFLIIFFAELGDKSQIAPGLFGLYYNPALVFIGVIIALTILTISAIILGKILLKRFDKELLEKIANSIFIILGIITLISIFI